MFKAVLVAILTYKIVRILQNLVHGIFIILHIYRHIYIMYFCVFFVSR